MSNFVKNLLTVVGLAVSAASFYASTELVNLVDGASLTTGQALGLAFGWAILAVVFGLNLAAYTVAARFGLIKLGLN